MRASIRKFVIVPITNVASIKLDRLLLFHCSRYYLSGCCRAMLTLEPEIHKNIMKSAKCE